MSKTKNQTKQKRPQKTIKPKAQKLPTARKQQQAPVAFSRKLTEFRPIEKHRSDGSRMISFKEYVQDIAGSVNFAATAFQCNPGLTNLFAWLSGQALFYQEYTVKRLRFIFETEKATTLSGKVMFAFLQDSADPLPANKQEMLENLMKASGAIWEPFSLPISMANFPALGKSRFVRTGNLAPNLDVKTYDIGQLIVATQGMADTTLVGELYIEYEIELKTPIQSTAQIASASSVHVVYNSFDVGLNNLFGTLPTQAGGLNVTASVNTITFNSTGQFLLAVDVNGTGLHTAFAPVVTASTATALLIGNNISNAAADAGTKAQAGVVVVVSARGQTVVLDCSTQATTITSSECRISQYARANG